LHPSGEHPRRGRGVRHGIGHSLRASGSHLRSVLHHENLRPRHGTRIVNHVQHRARARRHDQLREHCRPGYELHSGSAAAGAGRARARRVTVERMTTASKGMLLVVDDEEIMRDILETLLTREGYDVRMASSGAEGLALARAFPFDAAIVDI